MTDLVPIGRSPEHAGEIDDGFCHHVRLTFLSEESNAGRQYLGEGAVMFQVTLTFQCPDCGAGFSCQLAQLMASAT